MFSKTITKLLENTRELAAHIDQADEFVAVKDVEKAIEQMRESVKNIEFAIHEARKVFERTKNAEPPSVQEVETDSP